MKRNYRLFYPAGLISIVLLPLLCIWHLDTQHAFKKIGAMDVAYYDYDSDIDTTFNDWFKKVPSIRKYTEIEFTGNTKDDRLRLQYAQLEIKRIFNAKDSIKGIHIRFTKQAKYWNFVKTIDICQAQKVYPYINNNDIWVYYIPPIPDTSLKIQGMFACGGIQLLPKPLSFGEMMEAKFDVLTKLPKIYLLPFFFFLLMWYFSIKRMLNLHRLARTSKVCSF